MPVLMRTTRATPLPSSMVARERWHIISVPAYRPVTLEEVIAHLRIRDGDNSDAYLYLLIDAATRYAEETMNLALCAQTIRVIVAEGERIILPRGPVIGATTVEGADHIQTSQWDFAYGGTTNEIVLRKSLKYPITVEYRAGFRTTGGQEVPEAVPADIRLAILAHVGTLYEARESTSEKGRTPVPHHLEAFYRLRSRQRGIA